MSNQNRKNNNSREKKKLMNIATLGFDDNINDVIQKGNKCIKS